MCCRDGSVAHLCIQPVGLLHLLCGKHPPEQGDAARPQEMLSKSTDATKFNRAIISLKAQPPLGSLCMLALFISCHCSGPCADANYSNADRRSVYSCVSCCVQIWKSGFPAKAPRSHRKGETLKLPSYRQNDVPELFQPFPKICTLLARLSDIHYNSQTALPAKCPSVLSQVPLTVKQ